LIAATSNRFVQFQKRSQNFICGPTKRFPSSQCASATKCLEILDALRLKALLNGASLPGIECDEVIHSILDVMYANAPYTVIQRAMRIHPTVSELIPTMLGELKPLE